MVRRSDKQQAMQTLRDITQHLKHNPAEASAVMAAIQSGVVEDATTPSSGKICTPTSRTKIGCLAAKLYRYVIAEAEPTVTKDLLVRLDKANPKCSQQLFYFFLRSLQTTLCGHTTWTSLCLATLSGTRFCNSLAGGWVGQSLESQTGNKVRTA